MIDIPVEHQLLTNAHNLQKWVTQVVSPFLGQRIMEAGAGIGNHSVWLPLRERLLLTEADSELLPILETRVYEAFEHDPRVDTKLVDPSKDWVSELSSENLDTIISFNFLEHIEDDQKAIADYIQILQRSDAKGPKRVISFVPAHRWLQGAIDQNFGHYRRYSHKDFFRFLENLNVEAKTYYRYFNLFGLPGWWVMGRVLKKPQLASGAIRSFERICPYVRGFDDFIHEKLRLPLGQSLIFVIEF